MSLRGSLHPLELSLTADALRRYPGESMHLFLRLDVLDDAPSEIVVRLTVPAGLRVEETFAPSNGAVPAPQVQYIGDAHFPTQVLTWELGDARTLWPALPSGASLTSHPARPSVRLEFEAHVTVDLNVAQTAGQFAGRSADGRLVLPPVMTLECEAEAHAQFNGVPIMRSQLLSIEVAPKARSLKHLPSIYESDELMSRLLMLCESFWAPIEQHIRHLHHYLDPRLTPPALLPWLASWADWTLDERWPLEHQRRLVESIVSFYRWRGTRRGLRKMLALFIGLDETDDRIQIVEHRAGNFVLGPSACLGTGVALGTGNAPHTFSVTLRLPSLANTQSHRSPVEIEWAEAQRRRVIEDIIALHTPAHARCTLHVLVED
ncbi:MAG: phage tail protein [Anaerolineae bacterium]|nr:phage tail protein [Thermoflexales bacterium]MDW8406739.1 phage tail protein [Anaerolineae bacterium]